MSEENLPPIPQQAEQQQPMSNALGILAVVGSIFCYIIGLILSIIGLCKYPKGSAGRVLSWVGIVIVLLWTAVGAFGVHLAKESTETMIENIRADHPEFNDQQIMEYIQDPANKKELEKYVQSSILMELAD